MITLTRIQNLHQSITMDWTEQTKETTGEITSVYRTVSIPSRSWILMQQRRRKKNTRTFRNANMKSNKSTTTNTAIQSQDFERNTLRHQPSSWL